MTAYTDYCTCFFVQEENGIYFYDDIRDKIIGKEKAENREKADEIMKKWKQNAPDNIICQILE